jgi:thioredoxin
MPTGAVHVLNAADFGAATAEARVPVLVDFHAPWCAPCRALGPRLDAAARRWTGRVRFGKLDVDAHPEVAAAFGVTALPTLMLFQGGRPVDGLLGPASAADLDALIARYAPPLTAPSAAPAVPKARPRSAPGLALAAAAVLVGALCAALALGLVLVG